jgi:hypothetical protein
MAASDGETERQAEGENRTEAESSVNRQTRQRLVPLDVSQVRFARIYTAGSFQGWR